MRSMIRITGYLFLCLLITSVYGAKYTVKSPDKKVVLTVNVGKAITQSVKYDGKIMLSDSPISMRIRGKDDLCRDTRVKKAKRFSRREILKPVLKVKSAEIPDHYNGLNLEFDGYALSFRVYDNGTVLDDATGKIIQAPQHTLFTHNSATEHINNRWQAYRAAAETGLARAIAAIDPDVKPNSPILAYASMVGKQAERD